MMCFSKEEKQRCYKSKSPAPEHWWQFTLTRKSIFEHNFTAIALSSYTLPGTLHTANLALTSDLVHENDYLFTMGSLEHAKTELLSFSTWK